MSVDEEAKRLANFADLCQKLINTHRPPYSSETLVPISLGDVGNIIHRCEAELPPGLQNTTSAQGIHMYIDNRTVQVLYELSTSVVEGSIYAS